MGPGVSFRSPGSERASYTARGYEADAALGVRYVPRRHFGIFGEAGVEYGEDTGDGEVESTSGDFHTRGAAGVIFYF